MINKLFYIAGGLMLWKYYKSSKVTAGTGSGSNWTRAVKSLGTLSNQQLNNVKLIVKDFGKLGDGDKRKLAYILATAYYESKFLPVREKRAKQGTALRATQNAYWYTGFYGRGFVQLTWESNYRKFGNLLGINLVNNPDLALNPNTAGKILVLGMMNGLFTGVSLSNYINSSSADFYNARRVVNGTNRASLIESYTLTILNNL